MSRRGEGGEKNDDGKYLLLFIVAVAGAWLVWHALRPQFLWITLGFDLIQLKALNTLGLLDERGIQWMNWMSATISGVNSPNEVTWAVFQASQEEAGLRTRFIWMPICILLTIFVLFTMKGEGFKRNYSLTGRAPKEVFRFMGLKINNGFLKTLIIVLTTLTFTKSKLVSRKKEWVDVGASFSLYQAKHWREALAGATFDPERPDPNMKPQLTPPQWMKAHGISLNNGNLDIRAAEKAFSSQLGASWVGSEALDKAPTHVKAIMVMAALNVKRDKKLDALRAAITESYILRPSKASEEVEVLIAPYLADKKIRAAIEKRASKHGWTNTATIAVYGWGGPMEAWGGKGGVLSTSLFLWLKRIDRPLWYALNNVGRRAFHIEGAGAISHYFMERLQREAVSKPFMDSAIAGLKKYLEDYYISDLDEYFNEEKDF